MKLQFRELDQMSQTVVTMRERLTPKLEWLAVSLGVDGRPTVRGVGDREITLMPGWLKVHYTEIEGAPE